jgi:hypothetical protein
MADRAASTLLTLPQVAARPVRLQLSRRKGFDLQAWSMDLNGLPAINCARPTKWGNPFVAHHPGSALAEPMSAKTAVLSFRIALEKNGGWFPVPLPWPKGKIPSRFTTLDDVRQELKGKNLACWCGFSKPGEPPIFCHADVLLELANPRA